MTRPSSLSEPATFMEKVRVAITANLANEKFGVVSLAKGLGLSRTQLFRKVKAQTGRSVAAFIQEVRVGQVKYLLGATSLTIAEIAWQTGYSEPSSLRRAFYRQTGQKPSHYRRAHRRQVAAP
ncbi:MAG: hypothetical protein RL386_1212 [Bacteroidota bacterium]